MGKIPKAQSTVGQQYKRHAGGCAGKRTGIVRRTVRNFVRNLKQ